MSADFVRVQYYVERDGTKAFSLPNCRMAGGYRFGPKGSETTLDDYWEALARLSAMQPPRFRRPNAENNFGIVKCEPGTLVSSAVIEDQLGKHRG